jgi:inorganic triphosphatase YgiF
MDTQREVEVKLGVPAGFVAPHLVDLAGVHRVAVRTLRLRATYWDTEDRRLARGGLTLRHRTGEGRPRWTLKTASSTTGSGLDREEISVPGPGTRVPPALQDLLTARLRGAELHGLAQVRTQRATTLLFDVEGNELVEVVDDEVTVLRDGTVVDGWRELEVEQRPHGRKVAKRVVAALVEAGASEVDQTPKGVRALGAADGPDLPEPPRIRSAGDLLQACLANGLRRIVEQDFAVRRNLPDAVHQLRVACRRLRSELRTFAELLDDPRTDELRAELSWLADSLGAARDLEVLRDRLHVRAREGDPLDVGPVDALLAEQQQAAEASALEALRSPRYLVLLQLLHDVAASPQLSELADARAKDVVPGLVHRATAKLDKALHRLDLDGPDASWHRARIEAKRARYAAEAAAPVLGRPSKRAKRLQTLLGEHQDAVVAAERLLAIAAEHPDLAVLCARLAERERFVARSVRRSLLASGS